MKRKQLQFYYVSLLRDCEPYEERKRLLHTYVSNLFPGSMSAIVGAQQQKQEYIVEQ